MARLNSFALLLATLAALACGPSAAPRPAPAELSIVIDTLALRAHTFFLSDDRLMGRETTSPGADIAALYISAACRSLGLEAIGSEFGLPIPLESVNMRGSTLGIRVGEADHTYRAPSDFVAQGGTSRAVADLTGRPVLVGGQDDILAGRTPTLTGAIAVTLGLVASAAAQDTLIAHGAVGIVQLTSDENAFREWADQEGAPLLYLADSAAQSSYYPNLPSLVAGPTPSRVLIAARGSVGPGPIDASIAMHVRGDRHRVPARNIGCVLRGNDPAAADTAIAFTAHYDHLGIGAPDASGDSIYNGFSDNAAGVAMLLAIAQSMAHREHHRHSVLFLFFTGEERGLLGSDYYVAHPAWPLARTRAVINLDAGAPPALVWSWRVAGGDGTALGRLAVDVALARGWSAVTSGPRANSDYFPFIRVGVPAIFLVPGPAPYQGLSADSSQALRRRWDHYHQPSDEWKPDFPFAGLARYAEFALRIALALDRTGRR